MFRSIGLVLLLSAWGSLHAEGARVEQTPYADPKVVFDFFLDEPAKMGSALYWIRSYLNPLTEPPYSMAPEFMDIKVVIHGTEIVTVAKKNEADYEDTVARMRYYAQLGVDFRVCGLAAEEYGYGVADFQDFITVVPSAITELAHWQQQGYGLITPQVLLRRHSLDEVR